MFNRYDRKAVSLAIEDNSDNEDDDEEVAGGGDTDKEETEDRCSDGDAAEYFG